MSEDRMSEGRMSEDWPVYDLLPAVHRNRDAELGHPLRALLEPVEEELRRLREDIDGLYDNWFVETCAEWVLPYLGDLLGVEPVAASPDGATPRRAFIANTLRHRRRKGTPATLEELAQDITGLPAKVVEYFQVLGTTQHVNHPRLGNVRTPDLRDTGRLQLLGTPFDQVARTADVRHVDRGRGRYNLGAVGLHLWRLSSHPYTDVDAHAVDAAAGRWTFDPAGRDLPLFTRRRGGPTREREIPAPLHRLTLHQHMEQLLSGPDPVFRIRLPEPHRLIAADLSEWTRPPATTDGPPWVAVDPLLGRFTLPPGMERDRVRVDFNQGSPGDIGAGPHDRRATLAAALSAAGTPWPDTVDWQIGVSRNQAPGPSEPSDGRVVATLHEAVQAWNTRPDQAPGQTGVIVVMDSATYHEDLTGEQAIEIPPGNRLLLVAAHWPSGRIPQPPGAPASAPGPFAAAGPRPHLVGSLEVVAPRGRAARPGELVLDGLSIEGRLTARPGDLDSLVVADCTLTGRVLATDNPRLTVRLIRTVCAGVWLEGTLPGLRLSDSILHSSKAVIATSADVEIEACTILGITHTRTLTVSHSILRGRAVARESRQGYLRYSYAPLDSTVSRRYRCHPADLEAAARVAPSFTSERQGAPGFCRLAADGPSEIATGAEDGGELGAFHFLHQPWSMADLTAQLDHYLRFGLEAGVFFAD
ncbi:phage tail protein [Streptomyces neyagawaensis]|uniref:Phage tail protein n=1 Tax=Streptomyces neyagawaensis TaxID=42238 RepID=A0ABV3B9D9_9ACTN